MNRIPGRFVFNNRLTHKYFMGKAPSMCGLMSLAVHLDNDGAPGGRFAMIKKCKDCQEVKAVEEFVKNGNGTGYRTRCKRCYSIYQKEYRDKRRATINKRKRECYQQEREKELERARIYRKEHPEACAKAREKYRINHPDSYRESNKRSYVKCAENRRETCRKYYREHKEMFVEKARRFRGNNPNYFREYNNRNIEKTREKVNNRRARLANALVERVSRVEIFKREGGKCFHCGKKLDSHWHLDHLIPLSKGGLHCWTNVAASCPSCNIKRSNTGSAQLILL